MISLVEFWRQVAVQMHPYDWGPGMYGWGFGRGWFMPAILIGIFFILIVAGIAALVLRKAGKEEDTAMEILKKRYARGEISKEEFEEKRKDLQT